MTMAVAHNDAALLKKINAAVKAANEAEATVRTAQAELVSRSRTVGLLLIEAKRLHPTVKDFEAFLKKVQGLKRSRAYDLMRLAGGRITDEELKKDARERQRKSRKKLPKPAPGPEPEPISVTSRKSDTESAGQKEVSIDERKAQHADLDQSAEEKAATTSARCLAEFRVACQTWLPKMIDSDQQKACALVVELTSVKAEAA